MRNLLRSNSIKDFLVYNKKDYNVSVGAQHYENSCCYRWSVITGLSTMFYLEKLKKDYNIDFKLIIIEKEEYLGGKNP